MRKGQRDVEKKRGKGQRKRDGRGGKRGREYRIAFYAE